MTSKKLFFKLIKQDFRKRIWCPLILFIACFLALEVRMLMALQDIEKHPKWYKYDAPTYIRDYFFGAETAYISILVCAGAFLCALSGFAYLHSKVQLDTYHSLPVSRTQFFWSKYVSGILQFFLPFLIHVLICAGIAAGRGAFASGTFGAALACTGVELVIFVLAYSVSILAVGLTGNIIISILGTAVLFSYSTLIEYLVYFLCSHFFHTCTGRFRSSASALHSGSWHFSPLSMIIAFFYDTDPFLTEQTVQVFKYNSSYLWVLVLAAAVYSLMAYGIYLKRKSEAAGKTIAFGVAEPVIKTMVVIPVAFYSGGFFDEISSGGDSDGWFLFGIVFGYVLVALLMEILFRMDIRGVLMHKKQFVFNAACTALLFIILKNDVLGYDAYVPADSQIQSCAVSIEGLMPNAAFYVRTGVSYFYQGSTEYRMKNMGIQDNPSVMELARKAAGEGLLHTDLAPYEGSPEYDEIVEREKDYREIVFGYKLLSGRTVYRGYTVDIADAETLRLVADIFNDSDYKLGSTPLFNEGWSRKYNAVACMDNWWSKKISLTPAERSKLLETYQSEYMDLTLETVMGTVPVGMVAFLEEDREVHWAEQRNMLVYPQFRQTIALLGEYGFAINSQPVVADDVASISVFDYDSDYETDSGAKEAAATQLSEVTYTDKEEISRILGSILNRELHWGTGVYADSLYEERYNVNILFVNGGMCEFSYHFMNGGVPDFIQNKKND